MSASLADAESSSQCWETEVKEGSEKVARVEAERYVACHKASMAHMDADAAGSAKEKVESELAGVQHALAISEEARWKAEDEASHLAVEPISLLLKLGTNKDEMAALKERDLKEKQVL